MPTTRIATCTYCGTRAALVLKGDTRHELACQTCGAPLHDLKKLPKKADSSDAPFREGRPVQDRAYRREDRILDTLALVSARAGGRGRARMKRRLIRGAFDLIEDLFD